MMTVLPSFCPDCTCRALRSYLRGTSGREGLGAAKNRGLGAFTLVELLVVIAILSILASLLLPVLAKARASAYEVTCTSNQKQLFLAVKSYADDHGGRLPRGYGADFAWLRWWDIIGEQPKLTHADPNVQAARQEGYLPWDRYRFSGTVWTCPEAVRQIPKWSNHCGGTAAHYGIPEALHGQKLSTIRQDLVLLGGGHPFSTGSGEYYITHAFGRNNWKGEDNPDRDCGYYPWPFMQSISIWSQPYGVTPWYPDPNRGHSGRGVFVFADGHAESHDRDWMHYDNKQVHWKYP